MIISRNKSKNPPDMHIAFLGFGEAANAFLSGWDDRRPKTVSAFDIKTDKPSDRAEMEARYQAACIRGHSAAALAVDGADAIFSVVTADQALAAAQSVCNALKPGAFYFDCNSCAPETKRAAARLVDAAGGRYVDVAVMSPVHPARHRAPLLISGPFAGEAMDAMERLDMNATLLDGAVGFASSVKMVRSIMIKGMEALMAECVLAGRKAGVDELVFASLNKSYPGFDWPEKASYMLERMMVHGKRRAAEMREVALTVEQLGLGNAMSKATVEWQQTLGDFELDPAQDDYVSCADAVLNGVRGKTST